MSFPTLSANYNLNVRINSVHRSDVYTLTSHPKVVLAVLTAWLFCYILTLTEVFPSDPEKVGYFARTDTRTQVLHDSSWFRFPYPGRLRNKYIDEFNWAKLMQILCEC